MALTESPYFSFKYNKQLYPTSETGQARTRYGQGVIIILVIITTYGQRTSS